MTNRGAGTLAEASTGPLAEYLRPVFHEIGNLLAAIRMSGHFLGEELVAPDRAQISGDVELLALQAAAWLGQLRSLSDPSLEPRNPAKLGDILSGLEATLEGAADAERFKIAKGRGLPLVRVEREALHHVLVGLVTGALAQSPEGKAVQLRARVEAHEVLVEISDHCVTVAAPAAEGEPARALTGRALNFAMADAVLRGMGGQLRQLPRRQGNRIVLSLSAFAR